MEKIYLKRGAEDIQGNRLNTRLEYTLIHMGLTHSIISNGYKEIHINNKYVNLEQLSSRFFHFFG